VGCAPISSQRRLITCRRRYTLNYKRIPYKTVWVEYPDIKALSLEIGAQPTSFDDAGVGEYTLPTIRDPELGTVTNSYDIALALDKRYPERPVVPAGTAALQVAWHGAIGQFIHRVCHSGWLVMSEAYATAALRTYTR
jgi:hypothetical protein